jgi:hypothetical protein
MDMGAYVIVINADKVTVTGAKAENKTYFRHVNGRPGSYKIESFNELQRVRVVCSGMCVCVWWCWWWWWCGSGHVVWRVVRVLDTV